MSNDERTVAELLDRQAIHDVVLRYCRGIDRRDFELVRSCYHPDGIDHHTGFDGNVDEYLAWVQPKLEELAGTMHHVGNHLVELYGDLAISETYATNVHWGHPEIGAFTSGARFVDLMERRGGRWAIKERWAVREWTRSDTGRMIAPEAPGPRGTHGESDLVYALRQRVSGLL